MRRMRSTAAALLAASLMVGCGPSEAQRQAEEAREAADAAARQVETATRDMSTQVKNAATEMSKSANQMAEAAKQEGAEAAASMMQAGAGAAVAAASATLTAAAAVSRAAKTGAVKAALVGTAGLDASGIDVDTSADGKVVTLKGWVGTAAEKAAAERTAHGAVPGVTVKNDLVVK